MEVIEKRECEEERRKEVREIWQPVKKRERGTEKDLLKKWKKDCRKIKRQKQEQNTGIDMNEHGQK